MKVLTSYGVIEVVPYLYTTIILLLLLKEWNEFLVLTINYKRTIIHYTRLDSIIRLDWTE